MYHAASCHHKGQCKGQEAWGKESFVDGEESGRGGESESCREEVTLELGLNSPVGLDKPRSWLERSIEVPSTAVEQWVVDLGS